jgi:hypothetical protein
MARFLKTRLDALGLAAATSRSPGHAGSRKGNCAEEVTAREAPAYAEKQGIAASDDFMGANELARQTLMIREPSANYQKTGSMPT